MTICSAACGASRTGGRTAGTLPPARRPLPPIVYTTCPPSPTCHIHCRVSGFLKDGEGGEEGDEGKRLRGIIAGAVDALSRFMAWMKLAFGLLRLETLTVGTCSLSNSSLGGGSASPLAMSSWLALCSLCGLMALGCRRGTNGNAVPGHVPALTCSAGEVEVVRGRW